MAYVEIKGISKWYPHKGGKLFSNLGRRKAFVISLSSDLIFKTSSSIVWIVDSKAFLRSDFRSLICF